MASKRSGVAQLLASSELLPRKPEALKHERVICKNAPLYMHEKDVL